MSGPPQHDLPLGKRRILIASSAKISSRLGRGLEDLGAEVTVFPVLSIRKIQNSKDLEDSVAILDQYDWVIFTSAYAVDFYLEYLIRSGLCEQNLIRHNICAVGSSTAARLADAGIPAALIPEDFVAEGVLRALAELYGGEEGLSGLRILLPRAKSARDLLPRELSRAGAQVDVVACYESVLPELPESERQSALQSRPDLIVFTSSSTVSNFMKLLGPEAGPNLVNHSTVAALGPITAATTASYGKQPEIIPAKSTVAHLIEAILEYFA
jgi:uroporphyrinogen III methyltransferase/synthase